MGYEDRAGWTATRSGPDPDTGETPAYPWVISSTSDPTNYIPMTDDDALWVSALIQMGTPREERTFPADRWDDHPHITGITKAVLLTDEPRSGDEYARYAAELVANLGQQHLAVVACDRKHAARRGTTVTDHDRAYRLMARELHRLADEMDARYNGKT